MKYIEIAQWKHGCKWWKKLGEIRHLSSSSRPAHGRSLTGGANDARNPGQTGKGIVWKVYPISGLVLDNSNIQYNPTSFKSGVSNIFQMVLVPADNLRHAVIEGASQELHIQILESQDTQPYLLTFIWLVVSTPLKNISQLGWLFPIYGKIKNVPNHQPVIISYVSNYIQEITYYVQLQPVAPSIPWHSWGTYRVLGIAGRGPVPPVPDQSTAGALQILAARPRADQGHERTGDMIPELLGTSHGEYRVNKCVILVHMK